VVEAAGIPTVAIYIEAFRHHAVNMKVPRAVITRHPLGRTIGAPFDSDRQRQVVASALRLFETATANGTVVDLRDPYRLADGTAERGS
jgi:hypothetical protein